jgi:hypothetical protein
MVMVLGSGVRLKSLVRRLGVDSFDEDREAQSCSKRFSASQITREFFLVCYRLSVDGFVFSCSCLFIFLANAIKSPPATPLSSLCLTASIAAENTSLARACSDTPGKMIRSSNSRDCCTLRASSRISLHRNRKMGRAQQSMQREVVAWNQTPINRPSINQHRSMVNRSF